jgi:hypothetical protein
VSASERRIQELEDKNRELQHLLKMHLRSDDLQMESGVSPRTGEPFMHLRWGDQAGQFTLTQARGHAIKILDAAAASEFDAALVKALTSKMGMDYEKAVRLLGIIRESRGGSDQASAAESGPQPAVSR